MVNFQGGLLTSPLKIGPIDEHRFINDQNPIDLSELIHFDDSNLGRSVLVKPSPASIHMLRVHLVDRNQTMIFIFILLFEFLSKVFSNLVIDQIPYEFSFIIICYNWFPPDFLLVHIFPHLLWHRESEKAELKVAKLVEIFPVKQIVRIIVKVYNSWSKFLQVVIET